MLAISLATALLLKSATVVRASCGDCRCAWAALDLRTERLRIRPGKPMPQSTAVVPVAWACFQNRIPSEGWSYLEVESSPSVSDHIQAYAAGALEAYLTRQLIEYQWTNMFGRYCYNNILYCSRLRRFLNYNLRYSHRQQDIHRDADPYWRMVHLQMQQLTGLHDVFEYRALDFRNRLRTASRVLFLSGVGDLLELEAKFGRILDRHSIMMLTCSALIKIAPGNRDIYFAHTSWFKFSSMLRTQKKYKFPWRTIETQGDVIPGHTLTMSSYPGCLNSFDDFHLTSAGLAVMETSLKNTNHRLLLRVRPNAGPLTWVRNMVASRLATSGSQWAAIFTRFNSGTYNNQWMILDYKRFMPGGSLQPETLWLVEQLPGMVEFSDITPILNMQGYWGSYNEAFLPNIALMTRPAGRERSLNHYSLDPRAETMRLLHPCVTDMETLKKLMRYTATSGMCPLPCNYSRLSSNEYASMCPRFDLWLHGPSGGTDTKITNHRLFQSLEFEAVSGPTSQDTPPFQWSTSPFRAAAAHFGQPDTWDFGFVHHHWGMC
ncbi:putative phospholipase B-like 2 [Amblyomma americanum]